MNQLIARQTTDSYRRLDRRNPHGLYWWDLVPAAPAPIDLDALCRPGRAAEAVAPADTTDRR